MSEAGKKFFVFHDWGVSVYEPGNCRLLHMIQSTDIMPGTQVSYDVCVHCQRSWRRCSVAFLCPRVCPFPGSSLVESSRVRFPPLFAVVSRTAKTENKNTWADDDCTLTELPSS